MSKIPGLNVPVPNYRRFLDWGKMKKFGIDRDRGIVLKKWEELYPLYVKQKAFLYNTKKITLEFSSNPKGNSGARYNPHIIEFHNILMTKIFKKKQKNKDTSSLTRYRPWPIGTLMLNLRLYKQEQECQKFWLKQVLK